MGRELQKRKRRSSRPTIRQPQRLKKPLNPLGNSTVARNWNKKQTLSQNYRRLGLVARLRAPTGGTEPLPHKKAGPSPSGTTATPDPFAIRPAVHAVVTEARVERDADGRILRVLGQRDNPLHDPLNELDSSEDEADAADQHWDRGWTGTATGTGAGGPGKDEEEWGGIADENGPARPRVVRELELEASRPMEKRARHQSEQEVEWLQRLVKRHGDDTAAMARDARLNPMQQTSRDIARRIKRWRERGES